MTKSSKTKSTKQRVKVKNLTAVNKKMTGKELKKVKGGYDFNNDGLIEVKKRKTPSPQIVDYIDQD